MYVSGSLKNKTNEFYKEEITSFGKDHFITPNLGFLYNGEIIPLNTEAKSICRTLSDREEAHIIKKISDLNKLLESIGINSYGVSKEELALINSHRSKTYALLECLYKLVETSHSKNDLQVKVRKFRLFREYIISIGDMSETDLDIAISLFLANVSYLPQDIALRKEEVFNIDEDTLDPRLSEIIHLGEYISPNRVREASLYLGKDIHKLELILPLLFTLKNKEYASSLLNGSDSLRTLIWKIEHADIPKNLKEMTLTRYKKTRN